MSLAGFQVADIFTWQMAVWVLIILITGFIGQFGKSFATYIMNRFRGKKIQESAPPVPVSAPPEKSFPQPTHREVLATNDAKIRKKEAKSLTKAKKKEIKQKKKG